MLSEFMCVHGCLHGTLCMICFPGAFRGQKGELEPLGLEFMGDCSYPVGGGTVPGFSRIASILNHKASSLDKIISNRLVNS